MGDLTFKTLRLHNAARCEESFYPVDSRTPNDWAAAICEEAGEVARITKRVRDGKRTLEDARKDMGDELADLVMYIDLMAARFGIDLDAAVIGKFNEVSRRVGSWRILASTDDGTKKDGGTGG